MGHITLIMFELLGKKCYTAIGTIPAVVSIAIPSDFVNFPYNTFSFFKPVKQITNRSSLSL